MGATFDPELVEEIGAKLLAPEAKLRSASVILAPTCNIQRVSIYIAFIPGCSLTFFLKSPLGGRVRLSQHC